MATATVLVLAAVAVLVLALRGDDPSAPTAGAGLPRPTDPGMEHVHGLGVNPRDGALYAATHFGVFRVDDDGSATRVGNAQDAMGFTVAGPDRFLASGHPDFSEDDEPLLGLVESTDAGRTWRARSLRGEADFHALLLAHDQVFGFDATTGTFMVSTDGERWERRSRLALTAFAVSPADPGTVLATSPRGLLRSADGGRSWQPSPGAPLLVVLGWDEAGVVGVDGSGLVHRSDDSGGTWSALGSVGGAPHALTVAPDGRLFVAVDGGRIVRSTDRGATFTTVHEPA